MFCVKCPHVYLYLFVLTPVHSKTSLVAQTVKRLPTVRETWIQSLGWEDLLEKEVATHSSTLAMDRGATVHGVSRQDTGVGCHFLLQKIFPTQGLNPGLLHCRQTLYRLSHQGSHILSLSKSHQQVISNTKRITNLLQ